MSSPLPLAPPWKKSHAIADGVHMSFLTLFIHVWPALTGQYTICKMQNSKCTFPILISFIFTLEIILIRTWEYRDYVPFSAWHIHKSRPICDTCSMLHEGSHAFTHQCITVRIKCSINPLILGVSIKTKLDNRIGLPMCSGRDDVLSRWPVVRPWQSLVHK